jgi:hypothetical protein
MVILSEFLRIRTSVLETILAEGVRLAEREDRNRPPMSSDWYGGRSHTVASCSDVGGWIPKVETMGSYPSWPTYAQARGYQTPNHQRRCSLRMSPSEHDAPGHCADSRRVAPSLLIRLKLCKRNIYRTDGLGRTRSLGWVGIETVRSWSGTQSPARVAPGLALTIWLERVSAWLTPQEDVVATGDYRAGARSQDTEFLRYDRRRRPQRAS